MHGSHIVFYKSCFTHQTHRQDIAFCLLYKFTFRVTWAVLPWTVLACCWIHLAQSFTRIKVIKVKHL